MHKELIPVLAVCALMSGAPALADQACPLVRQALLDTQTDKAGGVAVPITVGGHPLVMLIDTGGAYSLIEQAAADAAGLRTHRLEEAAAEMYGGTRLNTFATAYAIQIGKLKLDKYDFMVLPDGRLPWGVSGTLGADFLTFFDADFDFANAKFSLFSPDHCQGHVVYWTHDGPIGLVPFKLMGDRLITFHVTLDGKDVEAALDTGSTQTRMSLETAEGLFNLKPDSPGMKPVSDWRGKNTSYRYSFGSLAFEGVQIAAPDIVLDPDDVSHRLPGQPPMIIGMGILRQLHLYVAYKERNLYITAAGVH